MKVSKVKLLIYFLSYALFAGCDCARILGVFEINSKSHFQMLETLMKSLAARGHEVVVVNHYPQKEAVPNYMDIDVSGSLPDFVDNITMDRFENFNIFTFFSFFSVLRENCRTVMQHPNVRTLLESKQTFDLVMTEIFSCECAVGFSQRFNTPLVSIDTTVGYPWAYGRVGNPDNPSYIANSFLPYAGKMTFLQRLSNTLADVILKSGYYILSTVPTNAVVRDIFGDDVLNLDEILRKTSLVFVNSHFSLHSPRPTVPNFVEVAGLHIKPAKELPKHVKTFLDESEQGVVYFSMGSLIRTQSFTPQKLSALMAAFGALPERVLMKYTGDDLPQKPDNVMTGKWLPQQDILRHPNVKLFISHGGQMGTQEAVYAGVPVIGMPLFGDQQLNIKRLEQKGVALQLLYKDLTEDSLFQAIRNILDNKSYSENAKTLSARFRDRPMTALDTAVYWVEYVIRHRGAPHLRSAAADMPLYQYLLIDVIGFLLLVTSTSIYIVYWAVKTALRTVTGSKSSAPQGKFKRQ